MKKLAVAVLVAMLGIVGATAAVAGALPANKTVLIYGDSLTWESRNKLLAQFPLTAGWTRVVRGDPYTAACSWIPQISSDLAAHPNPGFVVIESAGNIVDSCPNAATALQQIADLVPDTARLIYLRTPASPLLQSRFDAVESAAGEAGYEIQTAPSEAIAPHATFSLTLPCLRAEGIKQGCGVAPAAPGQILVRNPTDWLHFCPSPFTTRGCGVYSSGEVRWAKSIGALIKSMP